MDNNSFWIDSVKLKNYKSLENNITTEVCVIGGGITGITTAYYLSKKGKDVVVVEKDTIASKTTGHTTGKVSIQHGLFYKYLLESNGLNYAKRYSEVNKKAIKNINEIIETENISCDFEKRDSFVFATSPAKYKSINDEVEVCKQLGIEAEFQKQMELPINIQGAVKIKDQAQFNSVKYISGLCDCLISNGAHIYEHSQAINFKKEMENLK